VSERIDAVENVANDLLEEGEDELDNYEDRALRRRSAAKLQETQGEVERLLLDVLSSTSKASTKEAMERHHASLFFYRSETLE
jgi:hypothetical protein